MKAHKYLKETSQILQLLDSTKVDQMVNRLRAASESGDRVFLLGVGGSAATASHAVNDFRKILNLESYAATDNVAELTARTNDDGWEYTFIDWLRGSKLTEKDIVFILSVGGGTDEASPNIVKALNYTNEVGAFVIGVVGRKGGHTAEVADICLVIPPLYKDRITPHTEEIASVIMHALVTLCSQ